MSETYIPNPTPVVIPATEEKIFDKQFCTKIEIDAHPSRPWAVRPWRCNADKSVELCHRV